jgi:hypothetical protein
VTAAFLFLDLEADTASYSAATHPPLTHYRAAEGGFMTLLRMA